MKTVIPERHEVAIGSDTFEQVVIEIGPGDARNRFAFDYREAPAVIAGIREAVAQIKKNKGKRT
jgi:hypothetical protein